MKFILPLFVILLLLTPSALASEADDLFLQGQIFTSQKIYDEALSAYKKALDLEPDHERAHISLAILYGLQKEYKKGLAEIAIVQKLYPKAYLSYKVQGVLFQDAKMPIEAIKAFENYLKLAPETKIKDRQEIEKIIVDLKSTLPSTHSQTEEQP